MIQKIFIGLNVLLLGAVIYLFVNKSSAPEMPAVALPENSAFNSAEGAKAPIMAYINGDSLNARYKFISERTKSLEQKYRAADERVRKEMQKRQAEAQELMQYAQSKQLPDDEARVIEERMARLQMEMEDIQAKESEGVMKKESEMQKELLAKVQEFLKTYTKEKGIDYVVNYQEGTQFILYGNNAYDITTDVINRLNVLYEEEKKNEKK